MSIVYGTIISRGHSFSVHSPTSAYYTTAYAGGDQLVYGGGFALGTIVSGGAESVGSGGSDRNSFIFSGGVESAFGGGVTVSAFIYSGGSERIGAGGVGSATIVGSGGVETIASGGIAYYDTIAFCGAEYVLSGGEAYGANDGWNQFVEAGGVTYYVSALTAIADQYGPRLRHLALRRRRPVRLQRRCRVSDRHCRRRIPGCRTRRRRRRLPSGPRRHAIRV